MERVTLERRFTGIDSLRGVAALGVAWFHLYTQNGGFIAYSSAPDWFNVLSTWGRFGVQVFFAISGFVVALTLLPRRDVSTGRDIARYFLRRSVRLDPAYFVALLLALLLLPLVPYEISPGLGTWGSMVLRNFLYFVPFSAPLALPVAWTLAFEVHFYLLFAVTMALVNVFPEQRKAAISIALCAFALVGAASSFSMLKPGDFWLYHSLHAFVPGILAAAAVLRLPHARTLFVLELLVQGVAIAIERDSYIIVGAVSGLLVYAVAFIPQLDKALSFRLMLKFGALSYCIYLLHVTVGASVVELLQSRLSDLAGYHQLLFVLIGLFATIAASWVVYAVVERPSIALAKKISFGSSSKKLSHIAPGSELSAGSTRVTP